MSKTLVLRPHLSEKTYGLSNSRVYVVSVPKAATKHTVARAIEAQFEVKVTKVNLTNIPGKQKRTVSLTGKRALNTEGRRSHLRKAYVTLAEGHGLPFFEAIEEEIQQQEATQAKVDKAVEKQTAKQTKQAAKTAPKAAKSETAKVAEPTEPAPEEQPKHRRGWRLPSRKNRGAWRNK